MRFANSKIAGRVFSKGYKESDHTIYPLTRKEKAKLLKLLKLKWSSESGPRNIKGEICGDMKSAQTFCVDAAIFAVASNTDRYIKMNNTLAEILKSKFHFKESKQYIENWNSQQKKETVLNVIRSLPTK